MTYDLLQLLIVLHNHDQIDGHHWEMADSDIHQSASLLFVESLTYRILGINLQNIWDGENTGWYSVL